MRPRPHLSWSSMIILEQSEETWIDIYLGDRKMPINRGRALGKEVADALESGDDTGDVVKDLVMAGIPKFDLMDHKFSVSIMVDKEEIPLLAKIDTAKKNMSAFKEYKTGATKWDQKKVDQSGQISFYTVVLHALAGKIPKDIELVWALSEKDENDRVELTGEIRRFKTIRTLADILQMKVRMRKAWRRMGELAEEALL